VVTESFGYELRKASTSCLQQSQMQWSAVMQHADVHLLGVHSQEVVALMHIHVCDVTHGLDACYMETVNNLKHGLAEGADV
jgi:hypothetical protein